MCGALQFSVKKWKKDVWKNTPKRMPTAIYFFKNLFGGSLRSLIIGYSPFCHLLQVVICETTFGMWKKVPSSSIWLQYIRTKVEYFEAVMLMMASTCQGSYSQIHLSICCKYSFSKTAIPCGSNNMPKEAGMAMMALVHSKDDKKARVAAGQARQG